MKSNGGTPLSTRGQAALDYAMNYGWPVLPLHCVADQGQCSCGNAACRSPGKHPLTGHGVKDATTDPAQIEAWWTEWPEANIGGACGPESGFSAVDEDTYKGGTETLTAFCNGTSFPETPTTETGRGGKHRLVRYVEGQRLRTGEGLDWRTKGNYIVLPPSKGATQPYRWLVSPEEVELADLPDSLCVERTQKPAATVEAPTQWTTERRIVERALRHLDPGMVRSEWLQIGMAIHHASGGNEEGLALWQSWGAGGLHDNRTPENYAGPDDHAARWESFSRAEGNVVTLGTLFRLAEKNGFQYARKLRVGEEEDLTELPELPTANEFLKRAYPEAEFLIGPIANHNIVIIHGPTGIGKTQMGAAMAKALGTGESWLHWTVQRPSRLLFIDAELPPGDLQERFKLHGVSTDNVRVLNAVELDGILGRGDHLNLAEPHWQEVVWTYVRRYESQVVFIDNVMSAVGVAGVSMASDEFWKPIYDLALKWRGAGLTSVWFDHSNSAGKIFGTKTKEWNADLVINLSRPDDHDAEEGCRFVVQYDKHRSLKGELVRGFTAWLSAPEPTLSNIRPDTSWRMDWTTDSRQEEVWALAASGVSVRKISKEIGVPRSTVSDWVRKGKRLGKC